MLLDEFGEYIFGSGFDTGSSFLMGYLNFCFGHCFFDYLLRIKPDDFK